MTAPVRLGAVNYLNVRPLVHGLDQHPAVSLRFDPPAECARLLAAGDIDLGMVPSITYLDRPGDAIVPGVCIGSDGAVDSVALFLKRPIRDVRTLAVDTSSRTSVALTRILCAGRFGIAPQLVPHAPDLPGMVANADGALLIGDPALFADHVALGLEKIDLGLEWTTMTGLPFVWAFWSGPAGGASPGVVSLLQQAAEAGHDHLDAIGNAYSADPGRQAVARRYLRESLVFRLTPRALDGLRAYYAAAIELGIAAGDPTPRFFDKNRSMTSGKIEEIAAACAAGTRLTPETARTLYLEAPASLLGRLADAARRTRHPEGAVTYIIDRNVNYTNVCVARCKFCAFYREVGSSEGYTLGFEEIFAKIEETIRLGGNQLLLQGGHNPDLPIAWYEDLFRGVKSRYPDFRLHALSPPEIIHISRLSQLPVRTVIDRLVAAGLDSIPGGGAEILVDRVRKILNCYNKATADEWLDVMRQAHHAGLRTTATMMYGTVETPEERLEHLFRLRDVQDETGGFTAFIAWSYQPHHTALGGTEATGIEYLRTLAIARLVLDNFDNLQSSWVTQGGKVGQLSLAYGANDMGSVMIEENVVRAAGAEYCMDEFEVVRNIESAGFTPKRRNMHYEILGDPIFRERDVPRMHALAMARADGAAGEAEDLRAYPARTAPGRKAREAR